MILEDLGGGWGEGVDINEKGLKLVRVHTGLTVSAWYWDDQGAHELGKPDPECASFWPRCIMEDGAVVGLTIQIDNQRGTAVRNADGSWTSLLTPSQGREFTAANGRQLIAGHDTIDHYWVPWIKKENEELSYFPHYQYHHHRPMMISKRGWIVGTASSDNCCHPLLWVPEADVGAANLWRDDA